MNRTIRERKLTPEEVARNKAARDAIASELGELTERHFERMELAEQLATLLRQLGAARESKGMSVADILKTADEIPLIEDARETIESLKENGYVCGIISESFSVVTTHIANKLGMHFSLASDLEFNRSVATGEVKIPSFFLKNKASVCNHDFCKSNAVIEIADRYGINKQHILAMGNSKNDICMVKNAGTGVAFCADNKTLNKVSDHQILVPKYGLLTSLLF